MKQKVEIRVNPNIRQNKYEEREKLYEDLYGKNYGTLLTSYQNFLYRRALVGLNAYNPVSRQKVKYSQRKKIEEQQKKALVLLKIWKQKRVAEKFNKIFLTYFPNNNLTRDMIEKWECFDADISTPIPLKDLGIRDEALIELLIAQDILPKDFWERKVRKPALPKVAEKV